MKNIKDDENEDEDNEDEIHHKELWVLTSRPFPLTPSPTSEIIH